MKPSFSDLLLILTIFIYVSPFLVAFLYIAAYWDTFSFPATWAALNSEKGIEGIALVLLFMIAVNTAKG